ncbi:MAG: hypothetical protein J6Z79_04230 [Clostridia bacterium]|nr:hypothetical protein [Clostridia bacterium]
MNTEEKNRQEEQPASYGGYLARHNYERRTRHPLQTSALAALYLLLFLLSVVGLITLFRGSFFIEGNTAGPEGAGKVTLPVVNDQPISPENAVAAAEECLIAVEVRSETGVTRGSGFVINEEGYAVCHKFLMKEEPVSVTVYSGDGTVAPAEVVDHIPSLGITILHLDKRYSYHSIVLKNSIIRRGQTLYGVGAVSRGSLYGLTQAGTAVSTAESVMLPVGEENRSIPILYTSIPYDPTLNGALVITENGSAAGFLTDSIPGRGGGMTVVPAITLVGLVNEIIK